MIVTFTFSRRIGYYLINFYVPCIIMVIISWIVFWMDRDCIGDRIALGIATVLTIVFLLGSSNGTMPRVSYPKAIDWYLMTSFIFVFTTLIMCLLIFRFDRQPGKQQHPPRSVSGEAAAEATSMHVCMDVFYYLKCCCDRIPSYVWHNRNSRKLTFLGSTCLHFGQVHMGSVTNIKFLLNNNT